MILRIEWKKGGDTYGLTSAPNGTILPSGRYLLPSVLRKRLPYRDNDPKSLNLIFWYLPEWTALHEQVVRYTWPDITRIDVLPLREVPDWKNIEEWEDTHLVPFIEGCP
jgi:hypothetical protein